MKYSSIKVKILCANGASFVSSIIANDIKVSDVDISAKYISLTIEDDKFPNLMNLADELGFEVKVISNYGIKGIINKSLISLPYVVTLIVTVGMSFVASLFVYDVRIVTTNGLPNYEVERILVANGIEGVMPKNKIDKKLIEQLILEGIPEVNFATVYIDGISLLVSLVQTELPDSSVTHDSLVSTADAIVTRVVVRSGTPLVEAGDRINTGDELIAGYHVCDNTPTDDIEEGEIVPCEADGEVYGTVYHHKRIVVPEQALYMQATGAKKTVTEIYIGGLRIGKSHKIPYGNYQVTHTEQLIYNLLPIKYVKYTYYEYKETVMDKGVYIDKVLGDMNRDISANMPVGARITSSSHEIKTTALGSFLDVYYEVEQRLDNGGYNY